MSCYIGRNSDRSFTAIILHSLYCTDRDQESVGSPEILNPYKLDEVYKFPKLIKHWSASKAKYSFKW